MLLPSGNDAALTLALFWSNFTGQAAGHSAFIDQMNLRA
jgi:hypothetical protein